MAFRIPSLALYLSRTVAAASVFLLIFNLISHDSGVRLFTSPELFDQLTLLFVVLGLCSSPFIFFDAKEASSDHPMLAKGPAYVTFVGGLLLAAWLWNKAAQPAGAVLISGLLATLGWLLTQRNARKASKKQHTMNVLLQIRQNEMLEYHAANIAQRFPYGVQIKKSDVKELVEERSKWKYFVRDVNDHLLFREPHFPVVESIIWLANYYEFICVGVLSGDLDMEMIKRSQRSQMCRFYRKSIHVLHHFQRVDAIGHPTTSSFLSLREIFDKWATTEERSVNPD